jgi:hypothetical protein
MAKLLRDAMTARGEHAVACLIERDGLYLSLVNAIQTGSVSRRTIGREVIELFKQPGDLISVKVLVVLMAAILSIPTPRVIAPIYLRSQELQ